MEQSTLTPKQQRFIDEYLAALNATQAVISAGRSRKDACQSNWLLIDAEAAQSVMAAIGSRIERLQLSQDYVACKPVAIVERRIGWEKFNANAALYSQRFGISTDKSWVKNSGDINIKIMSGVLSE